MTTKRPHKREVLTKVPREKRPTVPGVVPEAGPYTLPIGVKFGPNFDHPKVGVITGTPPSPSPAPSGSEGIDTVMQTIAGQANQKPADPPFSPPPLFPPDASVGSTIGDAGSAAASAAGPDGDSASAAGAGAIAGAAQAIAGAGFDDADAGGGGRADAGPDEGLPKDHLD